MSSIDREEADLKGNTSVDPGTEDELSAPTKLSRVTPRNSRAGRTSPTSPNPTPHANLRQLAALIQKPSTTPRKRPSSLGAAPSQRHIAPNTLNQSRTPNARPPLQPTFGNRSNPTTPHAIRALQQRRATPGRDRRKSRRLQRETPRDVLRNLSRVLAPTTQPSKPSPLPPTNDSKHTQNDGFDDDQDLPAPRFSIAIDDITSDEDGFQERPPRLSMPFDNGEQTEPSIEIARRDVDKPSLARHSRGSFGSIRASDRFENTSELGYGNASELGIDHSIVPPTLDDDEDELGDFGKFSELGGNTEDLRHAIFQNSVHRESLSNERVRFPHLDANAFSPFVLKTPRFEPLQPSPSYTNDREQPFEDAVLQEHERPLEDGGMDQPDILLTGSIACKPVKMARIRNRMQEMLRKSRHGISYPSLPPSVTKKIATTCLRALGNKKSTVNKDTLAAMVEASERYFEQVSEDLGAFAQHAGRRKIDESDVIAIMRRQRKVSATSTPFFLAQRYLPGEQLQSMRMPIPKPQLRQRRNCLVVILEDEEDEI
ncbi:hypothetical protein N7G274_009386 [Stereocaulon virgatum]|uniref:CENP-T/Histone H4 histone fold domain-containing protein n=1 Tax=Stereocaulon virgatum TaxID=373712 RepID=A0ABR3ZYY6_9LECA